MSNDAPPLPACQKCKARKVRCDRQAPKCGSCTKGNVACIIVDHATGEQYARDYIRVLEEQEASLRDQLGRDAGRSGSGLDEESERTPRGPLTGGSAGSHGGFVGDGSGLGFLHSILSEARWQRHRPQILSQLAARPRILKQHLIPNELPSLREAEDLLENYFTRFHIHHTFLLRRDVLSVFSRIYRASSPTVPGNILQEPVAATPQDYFRLFMVFAISSTTRFRAGLSSEHPYGYFMAAETYLNRIPLIGDTEAIQALLLVARFGMYHHIGTSLWEISQVCMRQCIELRLHKKPSQPLEPLVEQHQRRIFWECYVLDRYSSGILGRPFAIAEEEITVALPVDMYDDHIVTSGAMALDFIDQTQNATFTEISIFISFIRLRRISSRIHSTFYSGRKTESHHSHKLMEIQSIGRAYVAFSRFREELDAWRVTVPAFSNPRSLYERSDWHDFMYHKDMLLLARGAMHSLPSTSTLGSSVAKDILRACYVSASQVIYLYANLMDKRAITWTRSYFQVIFTAGLTITYCLNLRVLKEDETNGLPMQQEAVETLEQCSRVLKHFREKMPDAGSFATVFDLLRNECIGASDKRNADNTNLELQQEAAAPTTAYASTLMSTTHFPEMHLPHVNTSNHMFDQHQEQQPLIDNIDISTYDNFNLTEDLMTQLEAGIGEYAWGSLPTDTNFWDQFSFA